MGLFSVNILQFTCFTRHKENAGYVFVLFLTLKLVPVIQY